jgi:hypothetical protein
MYLLYIFSLSSTHLWLRCSNYFNPSKKKYIFSLCCKPTVGETGKAKDSSAPLRMKPFLNLPAVSQRCETFSYYAMNAGREEVGQKRFGGKIVAVDSFRTPDYMASHPRSHSHETPALTRCSRSVGQIPWGHRWKIKLSLCWIYQAPSSEEEWGRVLIMKFHNL